MSAWNVEDEATEDKMAALAADMKRVAKYGIYTGRIRSAADARYFERCKRAMMTDPKTVLIFTRDAGMHDCGWWKNPDYNNCLHLSVSFVGVEDRSVYPLPKHQGLTDRWVELFFGDWRRLIWAEPPFSAEGRARDVWHYRVFTDPTYRTPLLPRGEVYTREFTMAGWKSWSDLHGDKVEARKEAP